MLVLHVILMDIVTSHGGWLCVEKEVLCPSLGATSRRACSTSSESVVVGELPRRQSGRSTATTPLRRDHREKIRPNRPAGSVRGDHRGIWGREFAGGGYV